MAAVLGAAAVFLAVSGGFRTTVGGFRLSSRSPLPILLLALVNFSVWLAQARRSNAVVSDLEAVWNALHRHSKFVIAIALAAGAIATAFATRSAAGADASGYLSEAVMFSNRAQFFHERLSVELNDPTGWLTTPLGWRPKLAGLQSPTYAPGLPLLMAVPHAVAGMNGAFIVIIASVVITVVSTGLIAAQLGGGIAAIIAATLIAFTPVFTYQSLQLMSDVPVTAAWMLCFALLLANRSLEAGIACAFAVLIRPNLAPIAIVPLLLAPRRMAFAFPVAAGGVLLAFMQWLWYGSPLQSGYGAASELFASSNIAPNLGRYSRWWLATAPATLLGVFGVIRLRANRAAQALAGFSMLVIASYLIYAVFDDWSYLRFLLPAIAVAAIFASVELATWIERRGTSVRAPLLYAVVIGLTAYNIWIARSLDTFTLGDQLARVSTVADHINANVAPDAVLVAGEQSGAMRYYTARSILRWEAATPDALKDVLPKLEQSNRPVFVVLDAWEEPLFRAKLSAVVSLDWPPMLEAGTSHRTRLWRLDDRARFLRGERVDTIRVR